MLPTKIQKQVLTICAELMGENSGLYYYGLSSHPRFIEAVGEYGNPKLILGGTLNSAKRQLGLNGSSTGEIVYEGEVDMQIHVPVPTKPKLSITEQHVLEGLALLVFPKGGYFGGYRKEMVKSTGLSRGQLDRIFTKLKEKFNVENIEQALVASLATGILNPYELFEGNLPKPLRLIMSSQSYRRATQYSTQGIYTRTLTNDEGDIAIEFIERMGLNSGLYWIGWRQDIAAKTRKKSSTIKYSLEKMSRTFGISHKGNLFYAVSMNLYKPIVVHLPPKVEVEFNELELRVMQETVNHFLSAGGYYDGFIQDLCESFHYSKTHIVSIYHNIIQKTRTANLGHAAAYFIANGLIPISQLHPNSLKTPALEAIITAMREHRYLPERQYSQVTFK